MTNPIIAKEYRGETLENIHHGLICVIDKNKNVIYQKGDIDQKIFYRSAMKPLQAIPAFKADIIKKYGITEEEAALFTASQRGEVYHEKALSSLSEKLGLTDENLVCASSYPLNEDPKINYVIASKPKRRLMHNCAGKHLGFLAYSKEEGYDMTTYTDVNHPMQREIKQYISDLSETPLDQMNLGMDGCGASIYAVPLKNMAVSYLKFAIPELIEDGEMRQAVTQIGHVMNAHPNIVASHDFICSVLLKDPNIVAKGGAQGVYCLSLREEKISIALKVLSGTELLWPLIVAEILKKLNYRNHSTIERLQKLKSKIVTNDEGKQVGQLLAPPVGNIPNYIYE